MFPFFEQHLKSAADTKLPKAYVFETGTNVWRQVRELAAAERQRQDAVFPRNGALVFDPPTETQETFDEYVSDPAHPVPFVGYTTQNVPQEYMVSDQRFAAKRPMLVYQTPPLDEDITVVGPVSPALQVSTTGTLAISDATMSEVGEHAELTLYFSSNSPSFTRSNTALMALVQASPTASTPATKRRTKTASAPTN